MSGYRKILVPIDFSMHSDEATRVAADLARRFDASTTLVHVYDPLAYGLPDGCAMVTQTEVEDLLKAFRAQLATCGQQAREAGAPRVHVELLQGFASDEIVDFASRGDFDLIVMGTRGRTGVQHLIMGSIAERVVRLATCPVLTVKSASQQQAA